MTWLRLAFALAALAFVAGCANDERPIDPVWGKQPCAHCAMLVGNKRSAAQLVTETKERRYFDDLGCMVVWTQEHAGSAKILWARDAETGRWVEAKSARFANGARTPMDYGFEARAGGDASWTEVQAAVLAKERAAP